MYQEKVTLHIGTPAPKEDGLVLVFLNGLLQEAGDSNDYNLYDRKKIVFRRDLKAGDKVTAVFESRGYGWRTESVVIK